MSEWILMRGEVRTPPVAPARVALATEVSACGAGAAPSARCAKDVRVSLPGAKTAADYEGFYYVILRRGNNELAVSAPVWVDPPAQ